MKKAPVRFKQQIGAMSSVGWLGSGHLQPGTKQVPPSGDSLGVTGAAGVGRAWTILTFHLLE